MTCNPSCRGNALFIIFLVIGLVAAFSYAVSMATRASGNIATDNSAELYADQWITLGTQVSTAVSRMRSVNRCKVENLDFRGLVDTVDANATTPADNSCKLLSENGGGMSQFYYQIPYEWVNDVSPTVPMFEVRMIPIQGLGANDGNLATLTDYEFVMVLHNAKESICNIVNKRNGIASSLHAPITIVPTYTEYSDGTPISANGVIANQFINKKFGCISYNGVNFALYYAVLIQ